MTKAGADHRHGQGRHRWLLLVATINQMNPNFQLILILLSTIQHARDEHRLLTEHEAQRLLGVSRTTLWRYREERQIDHIKLEGGIIRYKREHIEAFIAKRERGAQKLRIKSVA